MNPRRSPSRARVERYSGDKRRYFLSPDWFHQWKRYLAVLCGIATMGIMGLAYLPRIGSGDEQYTHGKLTNPHAPWDMSCEACHVPSSIADLKANPLAILHTDERWLNLTCQKCHAGPAHHGELTGQETSDRACANCHHDHNGRNNSLVFISDNNCTNCHANLDPSNSVVKGSMEFVEESGKKISDFASPTGGHPEFRKLEAEKTKEYERGLNFSHAHHMSLGIRPTKSDVKSDAGLFTKGSLKELTPEADRNRVLARYTQDEAKDTTPIQLDCNSCHQLDAGRTGLNGKSNLLSDWTDQPKESILLPRAEAAYYLPTNFDAHCSACHKIRVPTTLSSGNLKIEPFDLPHRKQRDSLEKALKGELLAQLIQQKPDAKQLVDADGGSSRESLNAELEGVFNQAKEKLFAVTNPAAKNASTGSTCLECHKTITTEKGAIAIKPVKIPTVWFEHAKFNHASHRSTSCKDCHASAYSSFDPATLYTGPDQKIGIKGIESCRKCHAPRYTETDEAGLPRTVGGIRYNCTDCHRYHNGANPFQGRGAVSRDPKPSEQLRSTSEFLLGVNRPAANDPKPNP